MTEIFKECASKHVRNSITGGFELSRTHRRELADVVKTNEHFRKMTIDFPPQKKAPRSKPTCLGKYLLQAARVADLSE